jgi:hypothetical protein
MQETKVRYLSKQILKMIISLQFMKNSKIKIIFNFIIYKGSFLILLNLIKATKTIMVLINILKNKKSKENNRIKKENKGNYLYLNFLYQKNKY